MVITCARVGVEGQGLVSLVDLGQIHRAHDLIICRASIQIQIGLLESACPDFALGCLVLLDQRATLLDLIHPGCSLWIWGPPSGILSGLSLAAAASLSWTRICPS